MLFTYNNVLKPRQPPPSIYDEETMKPPARKRLKSSEPDLKITVGGNLTATATATDDDDVDVNEKKHAVEYWYHSIIMANHSNYIDAMLASPMKESKTYEISFPGIAPSTWEAMMKFLEGPIAVRLMTAKDVMEVAPVYDQYDFHQGRELCGHVLKEYFEDEEKILSDLDAFIDAILLADAVHLDEAKRVGRIWLMDALQETRILVGTTAFTTGHMKKLAPLIAKEESLFDVVKSSLRCVETKEDILSPLFPHLFVTTYSSLQASELLHTMIHLVKLSGSESNADGRFERDCSDGPYYSERTGRLNGVEVYFNIVLYDSGWAITGATDPELDADGAEVEDSVVETILWQCPNSANLHVPPRVGWKPVDKLARGVEPKLRYLLKIAKEDMEDDDE
jgi:hypothetical protein